MKNPTVQELRQSGYRVRVIHRRNYTERETFGGTTEVISEKGGSTQVDITTPDGVNTTGYANCCSIDNYNRKIGVLIALGRALKELRLKGQL